MAIKHLNGHEYQELLEEISAGNATVQVTRHAARHFFLRVSAAEVRATIGQSVIPQKIVVFSLLGAAIMLIAVSLGFLFTDAGWMAMFLVPLVGIFWTILAGFTTEYGSALSSTVLLAMALAVAWVLPDPYQIPLAAFAVSIYCYRIGHMLAQFFLIRIVTTSYRAWDMLAEHISITRQTRPDQTLQKT